MGIFDFNGKIAVVTGASSGLGADAAVAYAQSGADVAILARRKDKLDEVAHKITETGRSALAVQCDVSDESSVKAAVEEVIIRFKKIDILLNNAGIAQRGSVETVTIEQWDKSMDINVKGICLLCKYVVPHMKAQNYGRIVNISSVNSVIVDKDDSFARHVYNASKAAVIGLTKGMAGSYAKYGITVNAIGPGLFASEMTQNTLFKHEAFMNMYNSLCPSSRPGNRGELNGPVLFFSSEACSYTTGQFLVVDGGYSIV